MGKQAKEKWTKKWKVQKQVEVYQHVETKVKDIAEGVKPKGKEKAKKSEKKEKEKHEKTQATNENWVGLVKHEWDKGDNN